MLVDWAQRLKQETRVRKPGQKTEKNKLTQDDEVGSTRKEKSSKDRSGRRNSPISPTAANKGNFLLGLLSMFSNSCRICHIIPGFIPLHALSLSVYVSFGNVCCRIWICPLSSSLTWCAAISGNSLWPLSSSFSEDWADASSSDGSLTGTFQFQFKLATPVSYYGIIRGIMFSQSMPVS